LTQTKPLDLDVLHVVRLGWLSEPGTTGASRHSEPVTDRCVEALEPVLTGVSRHLIVELSDACQLLVRSVVYCMLMALIASLFSSSCLPSWVDGTFLSSCIYMRHP
jgi:hypothetical protein